MKSERKAERGACLSSLCIGVSSFKFNAGSTIGCARGQTNTCECMIHPDDHFIGLGSIGDSI